MVSVTGARAWMWSQGVDGACRLGVVAEYAGDRKGHAREVAIRVAHEDARGVPVQSQDRQRAAQEGEDEVEREEVVVVERAVGPAPELDRIVGEHRDRDHDGLPALEAIHTGEDVDRVGAEDGEAGHEPVAAR